MRADGQGRWMSSLRGQVLLLAGSAVVLLLLTLGVLVEALHSRQRTLVDTATRRLEQVAVRGAARYEQRADREASVVTLKEERPVPPPEFDSPALPPRPPDLQEGRDPLQGVMTELLRDQTGIEGGFFSRASGHVGGYAFPTHEGPGPGKEMPMRERPTIVAVARRAVEEGRVEREQFRGPHDVVLFVAAPVCEAKECAGGVTGAIWLMERLPGAESEQRRAVLGSALGFGTMALVLVGLAFAVLSQVDASVRGVLSRLSRMESTLEPEGVLGGATRIREFGTIQRGLDALALALRTQRERERGLQTKLEEQRRLAAIGQLAAGVAHELRNPLATIRLRTQLAQRSGGGEAAENSLRVVVDEVDRLDGMIERLLTFARPVRLERQAMDVAQLCREAVARWDARRAETGCAVRYSGVEHAVAEADGVRVRQVLDNLLENAVHAAGEPGSMGVEVAMRCEVDDGEVMVQVRDAGPGFSEEALERGVEPFFTTRRSGTGLGLSIAAEIVQAHGGRLVLRNGVQGGAEVTLFLPMRGEVRS